MNKTLIIINDYTGEKMSPKDLEGINFVVTNYEDIGNFLYLYIEMELNN